MHDRESACRVLFHIDHLVVRLPALYQLWWGTQIVSPLLSQFCSHKRRVSLLKNFDKKNAINLVLNTATVKKTLMFKHPRYFVHIPTNFIHFCHISCQQNCPKVVVFWKSVDVFLRRFCVSALVGLRETQFSLYWGLPPVLFSYISYISIIVYSTIQYNRALTY